MGQSGGRDEASTLRSSKSSLTVGLYQNTQHQVLRDLHEQRITRQMHFSPLISLLTSSLPASANTAGWPGNCLQTAGLSAELQLCHTPVMWPSKSLHISNTWMLPGVLFFTPEVGRGGGRISIKTKWGQPMQPLLSRGSTSTDSTNHQSEISLAFEITKKNHNAHKGSSMDMSQGQGH